MEHHEGGLEPRPRAAPAHRHKLKLEIGVYRAVIADNTRDSNRATRESCAQPQGALGARRS